MSPVDILQALLSDFQVQPQFLISLALFISLGLLLSGTSMFESFFSYFWSAAHDDTPHRRSHRKSSSTSAPRTRSQQVAAQRVASGELVVDEPVKEAHYPGLVNISGTYCFLNSTLQALSSLSYLQPQIEASHEKAEQWDVPTPVIDALRHLLNDLNTPHRTHKSLRPVPVIDALSRPDPRGNRSRSRLFSSREHQDAQELFQLVSSCIQEEAVDVDAESFKDTGFAAVDRTLPVDSAARKGASKNVFEGLTANRRSCKECGYTEAVMHFSFDNLTLPVPRASSCKLEDCLAAYTHIELLYDCVCRKCSMLATLSKVTTDADRLAAIAAEPDASSSKKRKAKEMRKLQGLVQEALDGNHIEQDIPGLKMEKVTSSCSTKQAMIARPPAILVLHLNRSSYFGYGQASKNSCQVIFPEILDLTPYTTSGDLSTQPSAPISSHGAVLGMTDTIPSTSRPPVLPVLYRLAAVVCHFGTHSFGHYITFRRKPRSTRSSSSPSHLGHPRVAHSLTCLCPSCVVIGRVRDYEPDPNSVPPSPPNSGWLRISDESVQEVGLAAVLKESSGTFMLYYERVLMDLAAMADMPTSGRRRRNSSSASKKVPPPLHLGTTAGAKIQPYIHATNASATSVADPWACGVVSSPRSSEETITPENVRLSGPGSPRSRPELAGEEDVTTPPFRGNGQLPTFEDFPPQLGGSSVEFPRPSPSSTMAHTPSAQSGRIVRNVSAGRSRTTSAASSVSQLPPQPPTTQPYPRPVPAPLVIESDPSSLPPGSSRTRTKFTPPTTPMMPSPIPPPSAASTTKGKKAKSKKAGGPQAPGRTEVGLKA